MNKSCSILIFPHNETRVKRLRLSHRAIRAMVFAASVAAGTAAWVLGDYLWMKVRNDRYSSALDAQFVAEIQTLKIRHREEVALLRNHVRTQQQRLLRLQEQIHTSQRLLAKWGDLRTKIKASLPRQQHASFKGRHVVEDVENSLGALRGEIENLIAAVPSEWPAEGWLSSKYGTRKSPWTGKKQFHSGVDIANRRGTPVQAPGAGVVEQVSAGGPNGKYIVLNHGQGITTHYAHLSKIHVKKGERVAKKQTIGNMGSTGRSTNPHLHYELQINGIPIDPRRELLEGKPPVS